MTKSCNAKLDPATTWLAPPSISKVAVPQFAVPELPPPAGISPPAFTVPELALKVPFTVSVNLNSQSTSRVPVLSVKIQPAP